MFAKDGTEEILEEGVPDADAVISFRKLKTDFKSYEAKRNLSNGYDLFLTDDRIVKGLPRILGKAFYGRNRVPFPVPLGRCGKDVAKMKRMIARARDSTFLTLNIGHCCAVKAGRTSMSADALTANVMAVVEEALRCIPGGARNVRSVHVKTVDSIALPIFEAAIKADVTDEAGDKAASARSSTAKGKPSSSDSRGRKSSGKSKPVATGARAKRARTVKA